ncbi:hypothetical protein QBC32DRAFT_351409, partial [Pseudoneurospora amorphoporcata]
MRQPVRYSIMDDYALAIRTENHTPGAFINGNTCVPSMLAKYPAPSGDLFSPQYLTVIFDITEDGNLTVNPSAPEIYQHPVSDDTIRRSRSTCPHTLRVTRTFAHSPGFGLSRLSAKAGVRRTKEN